MYKNAKDFLEKNPSPVVLQEPHPLLREISSEIKDLDGMKALIPVMVRIMKEEGGIGLAAPQIGFNQRLFIIHIPETENRSETKIVAINPVVLEKKGSICLEEGCLSVDGKLVPVERSAQILVEYENESKQKVQTVLSGLAAVCFQHELDHLNGVLISDYIKV